MLEQLFSHYEEAMHAVDPLGEHAEDVRASIAKFRQMIERSSDRFYFRENQEGHATGSALVCSQDGKEVLLTHHRKLGKWLQLGGHADGVSDLVRVSHTEALEESGLAGVRLIDTRHVCYMDDLNRAMERIAPLHLSVHEIPARKDEPAHFHYDTIYLWTADRNAPLTKSDRESHDLRWMTWEEAKSLAEEESMLRLLSKGQMIMNRFIHF